MARLSLSLLGRFQVTLDGEPLVDWPSAKVRALLVYLVVETDRRRPEAVAHPREALAGLLWPDYPERSAHTNLSNALSHLRTVLRDRADTQVHPYILVDRETAGFSLESDAWVDVSEFSRLAEADPSAASSDAAAADAARQLEEAVSLYRGSFLEGFSPHDSPSFEQWVLVTRERLQRQAMEALARLSTYEERRGEYRQALAHARQQLDLEPWREGAHLHPAQGLCRTHEGHSV